MTKAEADRLLRDALERHKRGEIEAAYHVYRQVLAQLPDHPTALHYLGLVAQQTGHTARAVELLRRSIRLDPKDARAHNHLGQIVLSQKNTREAITCFERALEVDPQHIDSINNLANVLALNGERERAIELYRRALELDPRTINSTYNLANALKDNASYDEALQLFERALGIQPDHVPSRHNLGVLLEQKGRFEEAIEHYREVQRLQPGHVKSLANLISIRSYRPDAQTVDEAERRVARPDVPDEDRVKLHHGLGKYYDRQQRFDEAFAHFRAAKAVVRRMSGPFEESAVAAYFDRVIETFSADYFRNLRRGGSESQRPVFIVGMPRSGTTLTEQILASHPAIFGAGELQGIPDIAKSLRPDYPQRITQLNAEEVASLAQRYLETAEALAPAEALRITDKLPVNFTHLGLIATLFPNARVIHCRRDPLDSGLSCFIELFRLSRDFTTDVESIGRYYLQYERLMAHWREVLPLPLYEQRYEELIADQEAGSRALVAHCGLPWDDACLNFQEADRTVMTPSRWQVRQPIYSSSIGRWRNYERHLAPLVRVLEERGYRYAAPVGADGPPGTADPPQNL